MTLVMTPMLKKLIAVFALASAAFVGVSIPAFTAAPAGAEQLALFECTYMGDGWYACEAYNGDLFMIRSA